MTMREKIETWLSLLFIVGFVFVILYGGSQLIIDKKKEFRFNGKPVITSNMTTEEVIKLWGTPKISKEYEHERFGSELLFTYSAFLYNINDSMYMTKECNLHFRKNKLKRVDYYEFKVNEKGK